MDETPKPPINVDCPYFPGALGDYVVFLRPIPQKITKADAIVLAAWLVAMIQPQDPTFEEVRAAVENL